MSTALVAVATLITSQQATLANDDAPAPTDKSAASERKAPQLFIGRGDRTATTTVTTFAKSDADGITSRGTTRNTKLKWRSARRDAQPIIQQVHHEEGIHSHDVASGSVLKNASAAPLPALDPFADRLAAQPLFEDNDSSTTSDLPPSSSDDTFTPPTFDNGNGDLPPATTDSDDSETEEPGTAFEPPTTEVAPEPKEPASTEELAPPRELPQSNRPMTREEKADAKYLADLKEECAEGLNELRIKTLSANDLHTRIDIAEKGTALEDFPVACPIDSSEFMPRDWEEMYIAWTASGLCHKPLYFEQRHLERYGHTTGPYTQPFVSGAHFFGSLAILPYKMGLRTPDECVYALGHYRPGNCAPYMVPALPFTARAALFQTGAVVGTAAILP